MCQSPEHISGFTSYGKMLICHVVGEPEHDILGWGGGNACERAFRQLLEGLVSEDAVGLRCMLSRSALLSSSAEQSARVALSRSGSATSGLEYGSSSKHPCLTHPDSEVMVPKQVVIQRDLLQ